MKNQIEQKTVPEIGTSSPKLLRRSSKSREVSSRFLSPTSIENGSSSPTSSPVRRKSNASSTSSSSSSLFADHTRKHRSSIDEIMSSKGLLWPSSSSSSTKTQNLGTLGDHLGHERLIERTKIDIKQKPSSKTLNPILSRQKSHSSELSRFEKENHLPVFGGSMRYATGKLRFSSGAKQSITGTDSSRTSNVTPGRLSVDENALSSNRRSSSYRKTSDFLVDLLSSESEQSSSDLSSSLTSTSRGIDISSRYLNNDSSLTTTQSRLSRGSSDSHIQTPVDSSAKINGGMMKRANSMTAYGSTTTSKWALSPGRSSLGSPAHEIGSNKGKITGNMKPPNSPSKSKGVGNLISFGLEMFKSKKTSTSSSSNSSAIGHGGIGENAHQLRLLHNRWIQLRFMNAKADNVGAKRKTQAEKNLLNASTSLSNLRSSVAQKRLQFDKEKLEFKLNTILQSQVKQLEAWGDMERQHSSAISETKDCLHSVVCRVPLVEGAKIDPQLASVALRQSMDLTASIKTMLSEFSPMAEKTGSLLSELAEVVSKEKLLLEECFELLGSVSNLELQERSLKCNILQMKSQQ